MSLALIFSCIYFSHLFHRVKSISVILRTYSFDFRFSPIFLHHVIIHGIPTFDTRGGKYTVIFSLSVQFTEVVNHIRPFKDLFLLLAGFKFPAFVSS